jgi:CarboxypepD_reg-like domain
MCGRCRTLFPALIPLALSVLPAFAAAQSAVRGTVVSPRGPVAGAHVLLAPGSGTGVTTDSSGRFLVHAGNGGRLRVHVRAIGYFPISRSLVLASDDTVQLALEMQPNVTELNAVRVEGERRDWAVEEFESRRRAGFGRFFTRAMLAEQEHSTPCDDRRGSST